MSTLMRSVSTARIAAVLALLAAAACGKKADDTTTQSSPGTIAPSTGTTSANSTASVQVADVTIGRSLGNDKHVNDATDSFTPHDTIYTSVHTTGAAPNTAVAVRWTFQDGQTIGDHTETISPTGDEYTEFHISQPKGWPVGKYTVHVMLNGQEVQKKDFEVKK